MSTGDFEFQEVSLCPWIMWDVLEWLGEAGAGLWVHLASVASCCPWKCSFFLARYYWQSGIVSTFKNECVLLLGSAVGIVSSTVENSRR